MLGAPFVFLGSRLASVYETYFKLFGFTFTIVGGFFLENRRLCSSRGSSNLEKTSTKASQKNPMQPRLKRGFLTRIRIKKGPLKKPFFHDSLKRNHATVERVPETSRETDGPMVEDK